MSESESSEDQTSTKSDQLQAVRRHIEDSSVHLDSAALPEVKAEVSRHVAEQLLHNVRIAVYDDYGAWSQISSLIERKLPLRDVTWTLSVANGGATNTVSEQNLSFLLSTDDRLKQVRVPINWHLRPFLNLYIVDCKDNDAYKATVKGKIRSWMQTMSDKGNQWCIIYVTSSAMETTKMARAKTMVTGAHRSVWSKIKSDFRRDRCAKLIVDSIDEDGEEDTRYEELWEEILQVFLETLNISYNESVARFNGEMTKVLEQRNIPGWNFCNFFCLKEGLAFTHQRTGMLSHALRQYEQLEKMLPEVRASMEEFGGMEVGEIDANLLDLSNKPYRDLIYQTQITELDLMRYIFASEMRLLLLMKEIDRVVELSWSFIRRTAELLAQRTKSDLLPPLYSDCWAMFACLNLAEELEPYLIPKRSSTNESSATEKRYVHYLGTFYRLARNYFDQICHFFGVEVVQQRSKAASAGEEQHSERPSVEFNAVSLLRDTRLKDGLLDESGERLDELFLDITKKAVHWFREAERPRTVVRLEVDIAQMYLRRKQFDNAEPLLQRACRVFGSDRWPALYLEVAQLLALCQVDLGHFAEYSKTCLGLLSHNIALPASTKRHFVDQLASVARDSLKSPVTGQLDVLFDISFSVRHERIALGQRAVISCVLTSELPCDVLFDSITLRIMRRIEDAGEGEESVDILEVPAKLGGDELVAQGNESTSFCFVTARMTHLGSYELLSACFELGLLRLEHKLSDFDDDIIGFECVEGGESIRAAIEGPRLLVADEWQTVWLVLRSPKDALQRLQWHVSAPRGLFLNNADDESLPGASKADFVYERRRDSWAQRDHHQQPVTSTSPRTSALLHKMEVESTSDSELLVKFNAVGGAQPGVLRMPVRVKSAETEQSAFALQYDVRVTTDTDEVILREGTCALQFLQPFCISHRLEQPTLVRDDALLLVTARNSLQQCVHIVSCKFVCGKSSVKDAATREYSLESGQRYVSTLAWSRVAELSGVDFDSTELVKLQFRISYKLSSERDAVFGFHQDISLKCIDFKFLSAIELSSPRAMLGNVLPVTFRLQHIDAKAESLEKATLRYEVDLSDPVSSRFWLVAGYVSRSFTMTTRGARSFRLSLIAQVPGNLQVPRIRLLLNDHSVAVFEHDRPVVTVSPRDIVTSDVKPQQSKSLVSISSKRESQMASPRGGGR